MSDMLVGIYGASGFGREVLPLVRKTLSDKGLESRIVFVDDGGHAETANGYAIYTYSQFIEQAEKDKSIVIAIADGKIRKALAEKCLADGLKMLPVRADNVVTLDEAEVGEGEILCHFTQLTSNIQIGKFFHANIYSYVAHDCVIGDYVTFAPGVRCNGNVHIQDLAYIGTGAIIKQGTPERPLVIGRGAVVGMGAVVTKDVPPGVTVVGNPARILSK